MKEYVVSEEALTWLEQDQDTFFAPSFGKIYISADVEEFEGHRDANGTYNLVEIVRCRDCKFLNDFSDDKRGTVYWCEQEHYVDDLDSFCSWGERNE